MTINKSNKKILRALGIGTLLLSVFTPVTFATSTDIQISGNGARSNNNISTKMSNHMSVMQHNDANIGSNVMISSTTGNNQAGDNTRGNLHISTGDSNTLVEIANSANMNTLTLGETSDYNENSNGNSNSGHMMHKKHLMTKLNGAEEVPGPGDVDGKGRVKLHFDMEKNELCIDMRVKNIQTATAAHIHEAPNGVKGGVVLTLPTPDSNGRVDTCIDIEDALANEILSNPENYYVNVHNAQYPDGAVRGQL